MTCLPGRRGAGMARSVRLPSLLIALAAILCGCQTPPITSVRDLTDQALLERAVKRAESPSEMQERQAARTLLLERHPEWGLELNGHVRDHRLAVGMNKWQAQLVAGAPLRINAAGGEVGDGEQWVMDERFGSNYRFIYFQDGKVTSWQGSQRLN